MLTRVMVDVVEQLEPPLPEGPLLVDEGDEAGEQDDGDEAHDDEGVVDAEGRRLLLQLLRRRGRGDDGSFAEEQNCLMLLPSVEVEQTVKQYFY